jgi:Mce-associated membrane protein
MAIDVAATDRQLSTDPVKPDDAPDTSGESEPESNADEVRTPPLRSVKRWTLIATTVIIIALAALVTWWGFQLCDAVRQQHERAQFVQVARQGAINLTTIDWQHADNDVKRILDSATGPFREDFQGRSGPFLEVVKQVKAQSTGTVSEAGLESLQGGVAKVLVAVAVKSTTSGAPTDPRLWRMRISVQKADGADKVCNVEFVP